MDPSDVTKDDTTKDFDLDGSEHADNGHHKSEDGLDQKTNGVADSLDDSNPGAGSDSHKGDLSKGGNEDKKIFVGGIAYDVSNEDLMTYFTQYGEVAQAQVKYDRTTGRSRGFAFVEFVAGDACKAALQLREQTIKNKQVEVKPAKSRENKKVFVGGLPSDHPEEELRKHFEQYGKVEDIEWPFDKQRNARRNFAFIVFEEEDAADRASAFPKQMFGERECDVKKAVPQGKRFGAMGGAGGGRGGNFRGGYGGRGGGFFGGANGGWGQMGGMGAYGGGWGDWYGGAGNFYGGGSGGYGGYGGGYYDDYSSNNYNDYWGGSGGSGTGGYDSYSQGTGATGGGHQTGRSGGGGAGRYQQHQQQY